MLDLFFLLAKAKCIRNTKSRINCFCCTFICMVGVMELCEAFLTNLQLLVWAFCVSDRCTL